MREEIDHRFFWIRTGFDNSPDRFEWFLGITPVDILLHTIKNLLYIDPDIACSQIRPPAPGGVLSEMAIDFFIIAFERFGNIGVLRVKFRFTPGIVMQFLADAHPVFLRAVAPLIAHGNKTTRRELGLSHHYHEFGQRSKTVLLIGPDPEIKTAVAI